MKPLWGCFANPTFNVEMCIRDSVEVETDGENPQHAGVLNAFAAHIQTGAPLVADGREGINGLMPVSYTHLDVYKRQVQGGSDAAGAVCRDAL